MRSAILSSAALVVLSIGCASEPDLPSIDFRLYPAGGEEDVRYSISVDEARLVAVDVDMETVVRERLLPFELDSLQHLTTAVAELREFRGDSGVTDSWGATLRVGGETVYESDDFSFEGPLGPVRRLILYLRELSGLELELYGFA